ncbi:ER lumen protein-retaining receptor 3 [Nasonia vitripennis]|uniref:ER lumen protein-retaining receptor n=1 Tax=Nasonia vitripennis TaxID=7425 RepID=A0A7M7H9U1_NASVI|nr:ER lumen protein-retaining receptor 3 [Nasonia vitripennis]
MDHFENIGVLLQLIAMVMLLLKIVSTQDCTGLSGKAQILYALVFTTKFLDLPNDLKTSPPSFVLKVAYLFIAYLTVLSIHFIGTKHSDREHDIFRIDLLMGTCTLLALLSTHRNWTILPILWHFGVFLEAFALFPQIHLTAKTRYVGSSLLFYVGMIGCYRAFHIVHWLYLLSRGEHLENYYVAICGFGQFFICCGYFGWMLPIFKAQYAHLKNVDEGQSRVVAVVAVRVNGNLDVAKNASKSETSINN